MSLTSNLTGLIRCAALLAVNFLFLTVWGFAGIRKLIDGIPQWFGDKFGQTFFATFPGLRALFWLLTVSEVIAFALGVVALFRCEFLERKPFVFLPMMLVWSLFVFLQLGFGQWLTNEFNGAFQQFLYFCGTLLALLYVSQSK